MNLADYEAKRAKRAITEKTYLLGYFRERKYGLSPEAFEDLWFRQGFVCASCGEAPVGTPHVDHCHKTGKVRGILCGGCNKALGLVKENPARLRALADYAEKWVSSVDNLIET